MSTWSGTRVLVTGARGFIATHLCQRLIDEGAVVHGTTSAAPDAVPSTAGLRWERVDLADAGETRALVTRCRPEVVFHLASTVTGSLALTAVEPTFTGNLVTSIRLLQAVAEHGARRLVLAGSGREPANEGAEVVANSPYTAAKWATTAYARLFHRLYAVPAVIARLTMVYGPGQWDTTKVLPYVVTSLLRGDAPQVGSGSSTFDWVFVRDAVSGLLTLATTDGIEGSTLDIGSGTLTSVRDVLAQAAAIVGTPDGVRYGAVSDRPFDGMRPADVERTRQLTGWRSQTPLGDGLQRTVDWYRASTSPQTS